MKKVYSAPEIEFEDFALSTNLAACAYDANFSEGTCGWDDPNDRFNYVIFTDLVSACTYKAQDNDKYNGICYHNPSDDCNVFNS